MLEVQRIRHVLSKLSLTDDELENLLYSLLNGESKQLTYLKKDVKGAHFEVETPFWFPPRIKAHLTGSEFDADYAVDLSSIFMLSPLDALVDDLNNQTIFDLCAAPGGKTFLLSILFKGSKIISNEKSRERFLRLKSNVERLNLTQVELVNMDARRVSEDRLECAKLVLVDAPCTGQGLVGKGYKNFSSFGNPQIKSISAMQRGILASAGKLVSRGGYLLYSTCTFSKEENEDNLRWFLKKNASFSTVEINNLSPLQSRISSFYCYRIFPNQSFGAGGFTCLMKRS